MLSNNRGRGAQATLILPSFVDMSKGGGACYINYYVGFGEYECGISIAKGQPGWRWFANSSSVSGTDNAGSFGEFKNGDKVNIKLVLDDVTNKVDFYVNGYRKHTFSATYTSSTTFDNCRLILGSQHDAYNDNSVPNPLSAWGVIHYQVTASELKYKDANKNWVAMTSSNASPSVFHTPNDRPHPSPVNYTFDTSMLGSSIVSPLTFLVERRVVFSCF